MVKVLDETQVDLRQMIEAEIGPIKEGTSLADALRDWLHFKARTIPPIPRAVRFSTEASEAKGRYAAIAVIESALIAGKDVRPWLSNSARRPRDKRKHTSDLMYNDWQITHFHLGNVFENAQAIKRTESLLYAHVDATSATLLCVEEHGAWALTDLLRILLRTSPEKMLRTEVKGILGTQRESYTDKERQDLRRSGLNTLLKIDGRFFMPPGLGLTSSRHATRLSRFCDELLVAIDDLKKQLAANAISDQRLLRRIVGQIGVPVRLGIREEQGQFVLYDKSRKLDFAVSRPIE